MIKHTASGNILCQPETSAAKRIEKDSRPSAMAAAITILSRRSFSAAELGNKLLSKQYSDEEISDTISRLTRRGYLNDAEYCDSICRKMQTAGRYSKQQIIAKLRQRGLKEEIIRKSLQQYAELDETQAAIQVLQRRYREPETVEPAKLIRYLAGKGFPYQVIRQIIPDIIIENE